MGRKRGQGREGEKDTTWGSGSGSALPLAKSQVGGESGSLRLL